MKVAITIFICCSHFFLSAQSFGFSKTYLLENRSTIFHAIRQIGNDLFVLGQIGADTSGHSGVFIARMDTLGNIIKLRTFYDPLNQNNLEFPMSSYEAFISTHDKGFAFAGSTRFGKSIFLIEVDSTFEIRYFKEFPGVHKNKVPLYMIIFLDAIYTIGFVQTINFDFDVFIFKTDLVGNKIWEKSYGVSAWDENAKSAIINDTTLTILSSETFDPNDNVYNDEDTWNKIFSIDSSGVVKSTWRTMNGEEGFSAQSLIKIRSDYYYTTHPGVQLSFNTLHYAPEIVCRDSLFNLKWKRTYGDTFYLNWFSNIVVGQDNFLYAAGYIPDGVTWGRVCKINPENGDLIWEARDTAFYIPGWGSRNRLEGLTVLPGGSVIAVGYTVDYTYHENGLLYKVTADGCIDTLCNTVGIQEYIYNQQHKVKVYPNPAVDEINFDVSEIEVNFLDIFNLQGQLIMRNEVHTGLNKIQIDQESLKPGIYFWLFTGDKGEVVETGKVIIGLP